MNIPLFLTLAASTWAADLASDWPRWRGPSNTGMAAGDAALSWSDTQNIKWKAAIPGRGHSSPVVLGNRIFVTTAVPTTVVPEAAPPPPPPPAEPRPEGDRPPGRGPGFGGRGPGRGPGGPGGGGGPLVEHKFEVICLDKNTGKVIWQRTAATATPHEGFHRQYGSFASNSPVTDGQRLYVTFGSRGTFCYDLDGKLLWQKNLGVAMRIRLGFGEGAAPLLDDLLILKFDQESDSFIVALDKLTGEEKWRMARDEQSSWSQPLAVSHGGRKEVVVSATNKVRSYELASGRLLWEVAGLGSNVIPTPLERNGLVYVMSGHRDPNLLAIRLGREGNLAGTDAVVWTNQRGNSYSASPVLDGNTMYFVSDNGLLSALNATTGEPYYLQQRLGKPYVFKSSPVGANGKLYLATEQGDVVVVKMGEKFEILATNTLQDQMFISTPAVAGGDLILRGQNTLFCIREPK